MFLFNKYVTYKEDNIIYKRKNSDFKILQLTDLHLSNNLTQDFVNDKPELTYKNIKNLVNKYKPNLIVFTGDIFFHSTSKINEFRLFMDSLKTLWTFAFGNHDALTINEKINIINEFKKSKYCIFKNEYENHKTIRMGDHLIQLREKTTNKLVYAFYMFDSGMHSTQSKINLRDNSIGYESVWEDQLEHYETVITSLNARYNEQDNNLFKKVPHIIFQHIPVIEYKTFFDDTSSRILLYGNKNEEECFGKINTHEFELVKNMGATSIFVGHDHSNDYAIKVDDFIFGYGSQAGYSNIYTGNLVYPKGGVLITINNKQQLKSEIVKFEFNNN